MYEILEKLMKEKGVKASDVAKETGIPSSVFTDWKKGRYTPKADKLYVLAKYFNIPRVFTLLFKASLMVVIDGLWWYTVWYKCGTDKLIADILTLCHRVRNAIINCAFRHKGINRFTERRATVILSSHLTDNSLLFFLAK